MAAIGFLNMAAGLLMPTSGRVVFVALLSQPMQIVRRSGPGRFASLVSIKARGREYRRFGYAIGAAHGRGRLLRPVGRLGGRGRVRPVDNLTRTRTSEKCHLTLVSLCPTCSVNTDISFRVVRRA